MSYSESIDWVMERDSPFREAFGIRTVSQSDTHDPASLHPEDISFRVETKQVYICTYGNCNKEYSRKPDLICHYRGAHLNDQRYKCRVPNCERSMRGFSRRDKRDTHERKVHMRQK